MNLEYGKLEKYPIEWCPNFIRIGNIDINNPNHFFYAINYGFKSFRELSYDDKMTFISTQRKEISEKITKEKWSSFGFHQIVQNFQSNIFQYNVEKYDIILKIISDINNMKTHIFENMSIQDKQMIFQEFQLSFSMYLNEIESKEQKNEHYIITSNN